jgi:type VI secretion system secreted protein Hcp
MVMPVDMFMKMKGDKSGVIQGESRDGDKELKDTIIVLKWSWGMVAPMDVATAHRSGRSQILPFTFTKFIDRATPTLETALLSNEGILEATLTCRKAGVSGGDPVKFLVIKFENAMIQRIARSVDHNDQKFTEDITIMFVKYSENYIEVTPTGGVGAKHSSDWDVTRP